MIDTKPLHISFDKIGGFIRVYDGTRYLALFESKKYDFIYNRIRYLIGLKSGTTYVLHFCIYSYTTFLIIMQKPT